MVGTVFQNCDRRPGGVLVVLEPMGSCRSCSASMKKTACLVNATD